MRYFLMLVLLSTLFIVGCDDRGNNDPTMDISVKSDYDNMVYNKTGLNELTFLFQLDGPNSKIANQRINVTMATSIGNFIGTGSNQSIITNEFGYAEGRFVAGTGYGSTSIEFSLETWPDEKKIYPITIIDFPKIDSLTASTYSLLPDGVSSTSIHAHLSSANADLELIKILFETTDGRITQSASFGDIEGIASTNLIAPSHESFITVTAKFDLMHTTLKRINIRCENP